MADLHVPNITYTFLPNVASTDLHPDIIMWTYSQQFVVLAKLTVCFETNFEVICALQRERSKYQDLLESCTANRYKTDLITQEVRSRGFLHLAGFKKLSEVVKFTRKEEQQLLREVTRQAILGLHRIWTLRNKTN